LHLKPKSPDLGGTVDFTRSGGGQFTFTSVDYATLSSSNNDQVTLTGFLGGNQVGSLLINSSTPNTVLTTLSSTFSGQIDRLRVQLTTVNGSAMILDNFNFGIATDPPSVPEPSSVLALLGLGLGVLASKVKKQD
jgi:hypothetical protein